MIGTTVSHYKILDKLGEGGMGVVYKAEDTRLERPLALKFLPTHLLGDNEIKKRFEREAKAAAALNHPNICPVHEIDDVDGKSFIAMAFIEGKSLDEKIARGPLKLEEALSIAQQIAEGLEAAHEKGIHHRDIKPENVIVDAKGRVTITDFGLAQVTEASRLTKTEQTMGTVFYMSPEQTEGSGTDHRTDIWSLGVVLYEMITGQKPFKGDYDKAVMYSILNEAPEPITALRTGLPLELEVAVNKAIAKSPGERYQNTGDFVVDIETLRKKLQSGQSPALSVAPTTVTRPAEPASRLSWLIAAIATVVALALGFAHLGEPPPERAVRRFSFTPESLIDMPARRAAISPDGRWIAYVSGRVSGADSTALWVRPIDREEPQLIAGTEGARGGIFWSPDSNFIGFAAGGSLKKVSVEGGPAIVLCKLVGPSFRGGSWSDDGMSIVFSSGIGFVELSKVSASGGEAAPLFTRVIGEKGFSNAEPHLLPEPAPKGAMLFAVGMAGSGEVYVWAGDQSDPKRIAEGIMPVYAPPGFVIYQPSSVNTGLWALPFSLQTLEVSGDAFPIAQGMGEVSVSANGLLTAVDVRQSSSRNQLIWRNRSGQRLGSIGRPQGFIRNPALSPDGKRVAAFGSEGVDADIWDADIWVHEVGRPIAQRLRLGEESPAYAAWSPNGEFLAYSTLPIGRDGKLTLLVRRADGSETETVHTVEFGLSADWSHDGSWIVYSRPYSRPTNPEGRIDLWLLDRRANNGEGESRPFLTSERASAPQISPDGQYIAYCSDDSGDLELYVRQFPSGASRRQVSENGGCQARWSHDGRELYYVEGETLMAVEVLEGPDFRMGATQRLFSDSNLSGEGPPTYDVAADGRLVMVADAVDEEAPRHKPAMHITENWYEEFRDRE